jgi:hypothetical protein
LNNGDVWIACPCFIMRMVECLIMKIKLALLILILLLSSSVRAEDIYSLNINAHSIAVGQSKPTSIITLFSDSQPILNLSQARLSYDQYAYQIASAIPMVGVLTFRFDQIITQNTSYYRLLFNADGTPVIDPVTNRQALALTYDTQIDSVFGLGYGLDVIEGLRIGFEGYAVNKKLGEDYAWGFDGDIGIRYDYTNYSFGIVARQLNSQWYAWRVPYREVRDRPVLEVYGAYYIEALSLNVLAAMEQRLERVEIPIGRVGLEYTGFGPLTLRLGWDVDHINVGAGFEVEVGSEETPAIVKVDYAAITSGALYDANRISISILF